MGDIVTKEVEIKFKINLHQELKKCNEEVGKNREAIKRLVHRNIYIQAKHDILTNFLVDAVSRDATKEITKKVADELGLQKSTKKERIIMFIGLNKKRIGPITSHVYRCKPTSKNIITIKGILKRCSEFLIHRNSNTWGLSTAGQHKLEHLNAK